MNSRQRMQVLCVTLVLCAWTHLSALAVSLDHLDPAREWRVKDIRITGNEHFSDQELRATMLTKERPWYLIWKEYPRFDPVTFATDIQRLEHFYEARGYYERTVRYTLSVDELDALVTIDITIDAHTPVTVAAVAVNVVGQPAGSPLVPLPTSLPVHEGIIFTEAVYHEAEELIRDSLLQHGYAHVETQRKAQVDLATNQVQVAYTVTPGPQTVFGPTRVEGTEEINPHLVLRELSYQSGERFSLQKIAESEQKLRNLELFRVIHIAPQPMDAKPIIVPMQVRVEEKPRHAIKLGLKYSTQDEFGAQVEWRDWNWFGDGRQLSFLLQLATVNRRLNLTFVQPHFLSPHTRALLSLRQEQSDEETFLLNTTRLLPRLEHHFSSTLTGFLGYRLEYAKLNNIAPATIRALGGITRTGVLSGPTLGLVYNTTEDLFNPQHGVAFSLVADQIGAIWGGDFSFYKIIAEAKGYHPIGWKTTLAARLKLGLVEPVGSHTDIPLFERLYAGGERSVRGYGRRRLGPLSAADDPLGGRSLIEGAIELRRPIWQQLGGAVFFDFGQVSLRSFDVPVENLQFAAGVGAWYPTPVGPLRLDIGFPFSPPRGDRAWQLHFSIGQYF